MDTTHMTQTDCMSIAQCIRDSILTLAQSECATTYRTSRYSVPYDDYIMQHFAQQICWMQHLFNEADSPIDMTLFREEIIASLPSNTRAHQHDTSFVTLDEAAKILRKSVSTLIRWRNQGRCPEMFVKIGAAWYIDRTKLQAA